MTSDDWCVFAENFPASLTFHLSAPLHSFIIALASKKGAEIWQTKAALLGIIMTVCLLLEYLSAAAPAGHKWKLSYARIGKLQVSLGETKTERWILTLSTS